MQIEKIKSSRAASFTVIAVLYLTAAAIGILVYRLLPFSFPLSLLTADIASTVFIFCFSVIFGNASVYDPYWSVQPMVILLAAAFGKAVTLPRVLVLAAVMLWGIRLTANWAYTFSGLKWQDWRYTMLAEKTGRFYPLINFIGIHLVPTLVVYGCILPAVFLFESDAAANAGSLTGFVISMTALTVQAIADIQMHRFRLRKKRGENGAVFIRTGLWRYSRHPNYLGELLMWWGIAVSAVSVLQNCWLLCAGALANTLLFLFVSIPMAENHQARKTGYQEYREETRMLLPVKK